MPTAVPNSRVPSLISVDIWADISCPWCYIGRRAFEAGLKAFEYADMVRVTYRSYVLNPDAPLDFDGSARDFLLRHKGVSAGQVEQMVAKVRQRAAEVGLVYDIDKLRIANMKKAHEVLHFAKVHGLQLELVERLFTAFFAEGRDLGNYDDLADLAADVGLDRDDALTALNSGEFVAAVNADIEQADEHGITSVPFYLFDGTHGMAGAQPPAAFTSVLKRLYGEESEEDL